MMWPNRLCRVLGIVLATTCIGDVARAHNVELFVGPGFRFGGILDTEEGEVDITNTLAATTTLAVRARHDAFFEFTYSFQPAELQIEDFTGSSSLSTFDLGVHYIQVGGIVQRNYEAGNPFFGLTAGVAVLDPEPEGFSTETRFAASLFGGGKTLLTPRIGLRGEARLWWTFFPEDVALFCSLPGFCAINVSGDALFQGETTGGVFITF
jgi:hypothetical protein